MIWIMIYINLDFCTQTKYRNLLLNTQQKQRWNQISMKSQKSFKKSSKHFNPKQQVLKNAHTFRSKRTNFKKSSKHFNPKQQVLKNANTFRSKRTNFKKSSIHFNPKQQVLKNPKTFQSKTKVLKNPPNSSIKIKKFQKNPQKSSIKRQMLKQICQKFQSGAKSSWMGNEFWEWNSM